MIYRGWVRNLGDEHNQRTVYLFWHSALHEEGCNHLDEIISHRGPQLFVEQGREAIRAEGLLVLHLE